MNVSIRPFTTDDYAALTAVAVAAYSGPDGKPVVPITEEDHREQDAERDPTFKFARWIAELDGQVVGAAEHDQFQGRFHPQKFLVDVFVHPEYQSRGIGEALHQQVIASLDEHKALSARGGVREDFTQSIRFLERHGWQEASRSWESFLDVATFDSSPYTEIEPSLLAQGIEIRTLLEMAHDADRDRKLYDLQWEIRQDFPDVDAPTRESFEEFLEQHLRAKNVLPDAFFIAVLNGEYVGYSKHTTFNDPADILRIGQTGVKRAYRRRNIALALKLRGIAYAKANGFTRVRTVNESSNRGILVLNDRLGFVRRPAWCDFVKTFDRQ